MSSRWYNANVSIRGYDQNIPRCAWRVVAGWTVGAVMIDT
jgi:hypothetical protein